VDTAPVFNGIQIVIAALFPIIAIVIGFSLGFGITSKLGGLFRRTI
jgi:hypothetical protein